MPAVLPAVVGSAGGLRPAPAGAGGKGLVLDGSDPPWVGQRPFGSSLDAQAISAASVPRRADARPVPPPAAALPGHSPPWMWITVAAILVLAVVLGVVLAMR